MAPHQQGRIVMGGPEYTEKDLYYYGALFGGIIIAYVGLGMLGVTSQLIRVIAGLVLGVGLGYLTEKSLSRRR
jgi:hypothetical protein